MILDSFFRHQKERERKSCLSIIKQISCNISVLSLFVQHKTWCCRNTPDGFEHSPAERWFFLYHESALMREKWVSRSFYLKISNQNLLIFHPSLSITVMGRIGSELMPSDKLFLAPTSAVFHFFKADQSIKLKGCGLSEMWSLTWRKSRSSFRLIRPLKKWSYRSRRIYYYG